MSIQTDSSTTPVSSSIDEISEGDIHTVVSTSSERSLVEPCLKDFDFLDCHYNSITGPIVISPYTKIGLGIGNRVLGKPRIERGAFKYMSPKKYQLSDEVEQAVTFEMKHILQVIFYI